MKLTKGNIWWSIQNYMSILYRSVQTCSKYIENEKKWKVKRLVEAIHSLTSSETKQKKICDKNLGNVRKKIYLHITS